MFLSFFFLSIVTFYLFIFYRIFTEYAAIDRLSRVSHWLLTSSPPQKKRFLLLLIILSVNEISARIRLNSALVMCCLRVFLAALSKVFRKASLSPMKELVSGLEKSAASNIFPCFFSEFERLIPGLRRKDWILQALFLQ